VPVLITPAEAKPRRLWSLPGCGAPGRESSARLNRVRERGSTAGAPAANARSQAISSVGHSGAERAVQCLQECVLRSTFVTNHFQCSQHHRRESVCQALLQVLRVFQRLVPANPGSGALPVDAGAHVVNGWTDRFQQAESCQVVRAQTGGFRQPELRGERWQRRDLPSANCSPTH